MKRQLRDADVTIRNCPYVDEQRERCGAVAGGLLAAMICS